MEHFRDYGIDLPDQFTGDRKVLCPKCSASRRKSGDPCLSVNGETGMWHCHNCGWSGKLHSEEQAEAWHKAESYHRPTPLTAEELARIAEPVAQYFQKRRGISRRTLMTAKVFSCCHWLPGTGEETLCMAFPYFRDGVLVNVKYRDANKNMAQQKNPEPCLWNIDSVKGSKSIYITEGEIDALTLMECGFSAAVSVDKGAPQVDDKDTTKKLECVTRCAAYLTGASWVVICSDKDGPGLRLESELLKILGPEKCKIAQYPEGCKDLNEVLMRCGPAAVRTSVMSAKPAPVPGLHRMNDFQEVISDYWRKGKPKGLSTGFQSLDEAFTLQPGSVNIFTGIPGSGKSEFLHQLIVNAIIMHGWKACVFSPEMLPVQQLFANFAEKMVGKPFFGRGDDRMTYQEMSEALAKIDDCIKPILPDADETPSLSSLLTAAKVCVERYGCQMLTLDPYNEIEHTRDQWMTETEYVSLFMARLRKFARQTGVWVGLVAHPAKLKKDEKSKKFPVASLYDISGSANFYNKTDNGLSLWRDPSNKDNLVQIHIQKIKNKFIGKANQRIDLCWDKRTGRFYEPETESTEEDPEIPEYSVDPNPKDHRYTAEYLPGIPR